MFNKRSKAYPVELETKFVRILAPDAKWVTGKAILSPGRRKASVQVIYDEPILIHHGIHGQYYSSGDEYTLKTRSRMVWGQGADYDTLDYFLHWDDAREILEGGGG